MLDGELDIGILLSRCICRNRGVGLGFARKLLDWLCTGIRSSRSVAQTMRSSGSCSCATTLGYEPRVAKALRAAEISELELLEAKYIVA